MKNQKGLPRNSRIRYRFKTKPFDFMFQWIIGTSSNGGVEIGEVMYAGSRIEDGNGEDWYREFTQLGDRVLARAETSHLAGHLISASEAFLRVYIYYRVAPLFLNPKTDERYKEAYYTAQKYFRQGIKLMKSNIEPVSIPFKNSSLPGYVAWPDGLNRTDKTLLMIGGGDTFVEDLYYYIGPSALKRGYNLVLVDLPGQGPLPWQGLFFPEKAELSVKAVIDYLEERGDVDLKKLALFGISGGGYLTPRAASYESRIKALITCSVIEDVSSLWNTQLLNLHKSFLGKVIKFLKPKPYRSFVNLVDTYRWRWGAASNEELIKSSSKMKNNPRKINCPLLNIVAEQEYDQFLPTQNAAKSWSKEISNSKLVITPASEGADSHSIGTNVRFMSQIVFDWLDELFITSKV